MKHFLIKTLPIIFLAVNTQLVCSCNVSSQEKDEIISLMVKNKYAYKVIAIPDALSRLVNFNETLICFGLTNEVENDKANYVLFANDKTNECIYFKTSLLLYTLYFYKRGQINQYLVQPILPILQIFGKTVQVIEHTRIHHSVGHTPNDHLNQFQPNKNKD